jgi:hypothetical protein
MWALIVLCLKFLGIVFFVNLALGFLINYLILNKLNIFKHIRSLSIIKNIVIAVFLIINGLAFCYLLKMSLLTFETDLLNRKQLVILLIISFIGNSLLRTIALEYKKNFFEKDVSKIESWDRLEQNKHFTNVVLYKALSYGLGLGFGVGLILIIKPALQFNFLIF